MTRAPVSPDGFAAAESESIRKRLERRAPGAWELYAKRAESQERTTTADGSRAATRREEGWAARFWDRGGPRFAAASSLEALAAAVDDAARFAAADEPAPAWPDRVAPMPPEIPAESPPALFADLAREVSAASRGDCTLSRLTLRQGILAERIQNGAGLDVSRRHAGVDGVATAFARRGARAREVRLPFSAREAPDVAALARRLSDAATLPLSDPIAVPARGQWLLDPAVSAALLAALAPIFVAERPLRWIARGSLAGPDVSIVDDATAESPFDGEGVATRRVLLADAGQLSGALSDLRSARRAGRPSTGHGVRPSYRTPPSPAPRRIFFETAAPKTPQELLASVARGLYASALTAPVRVDLEGDRYEIEFTGVSVVAGRARGPVPGARAAGRLSELLRRIQALSNDVRFFPMPFLCGAPTLLVERATFAEG